MQCQCSSTRVVRVRATHNAVSAQQYKGSARESDTMQCQRSSKKVVRVRATHNAVSAQQYKGSTLNKCPYGLNVVIKTRTSYKTETSFII